MQGRDGGKKGVLFSPRRVTSFAIASACATLFIGVGTTPARAARVCELPATFSLAAEERGLLGPAAAGLVVVGSPARGSGLQAGDVIRQANGRRTVGCADLEETAAEAMAKGLLLLLAAERDGRLVAGAFGQAGAAAPVVDAARQPAAPTGAARSETAAESAREERAIAPPALPTAAPTPVAVREATLPPRADASAELAAKTVAAAAVLGTVDEAARFAVPLQAYERRLDDAKNAIAALRIEGEGSAAVRAIIAEAVGYHETARDIRRYKAAELADARVDQRGAGGQSLPYFSDSDVPRWVARYPFLSESLQQAPRTTHMLLPGEMAGRWNPDQAAELLWERAAHAATRLAAWGAAK